MKCNQSECKENAYCITLDLEVYFVKRNYPTRPVLVNARLDVNDDNIKNPIFGVFMPR